ncbi:acyl-CoA N-acyltransferase [Fadolivirus algeromassiliense]|jgi:GNAT superfamily N-acetyltransferase|uniref:Acyl-CoA N-acyltransferase n=1 Tax=Fadolivirus FV1/VV64 TaxID=3070911 RepID=A0A7D3QVA0_9VIRU|nr:acyl-CoA N-acyltransferase [Fadolivirus algeromassiliense]QKF94104.1 acyl-CoA N-acyltransferase [Fadolivirus FV1/VV64]
MANFTIQELKKEETDLLNIIFELYQITFHPSLKIPQREIRKFIKNDIYTTNYILDKNNVICGYCFHMHIAPINAVEIDYIAIHPDYQGKGLARMLFDHVYNTYCLTKKNPKILTLECEDKLIGMYSKFGCQLIPVEYEVGCSRHLNIMAKSNKPIPRGYYNKIINAIKKENDYSDEPANLVTEHILKRLLCGIYIRSNRERKSADLNAYNSFTKEGIS